MASPTTRGKYKKQALGEGLNTWGLASGLNGLFDVMDEALHGVNEITLTGTSYTLTSTNYTTNDIRFRQFKFTGNFAATITIPATQNWWIIENATGQTLTFDNGSNSATLGNAFFGLLVTNGTTVTCLTLPDGVNVATVAAQINNNNLQTVAAQIANNNLQTVAGKDTEIGRLGTADAVADMNTLGTVDVVNDMNTLATTAVVADMAALAQTDVLADMAALGEADVISDMNTLAQADVIADMNTLATTDIVNDMNLLASADVISDMNTLAQADVIADMNTLATADIVNDMNTLATTDVVNDMNTLATTDVVADMNTLATSANVTNMNTLADIQDGTVATNAITTVASNVTDVTNYSSTYLGPKNSSPTQRNDSSALQSGDLVFRTDLDQMQVRNAANNAWSAVAVTASNFLTVSNNLSDVANAATARTNLGGVITEISQDTTPQLGGDLDMQSHSISSGVLGIKNTGSQSELRLYCETGNAHYTGIKSAPHAQYSGNLTFVLPATVGAAGQVLTDVAGNGVLAWSTPSAGGGVATQMKFE